MAIYTVKTAHVKLHEKAGKFTCSFACWTSGGLHINYKQVEKPNQTGTVFRLRQLANSRKQSHLNKRFVSLQ